MATSQIEKNVDLRGEQDSEGVGAAASTSLVQPQKGAAEIVQEFYAAFNRREIDTIGNLFAEDCVYEDLVFPKPFSGRQVQFLLLLIISVLLPPAISFVQGSPVLASSSFNLDFQVESLKNPGSRTLISTVSELSYWKYR
jgi:hypothetical protein